MKLCLFPSILVLSILTGSQAQDYVISPMRVAPMSTPNSIRLECRLQSTGIYPADQAALFYRNRTLIHSATSPNLDSFTFAVNSMIEGEYSCGPSLEERSLSVPVIVYPEFHYQVFVNGIVTIRARAGTKAVIPPYIRPGIWHSRYHIDWTKNTTSGENLVGRIGGQRTRLFPLNMERFSVNKKDFSLEISDVNRDDSGTYLGQLGVSEGPNATPMPYTQIQSMGVVLEVYEQPQIVYDRIQPSERIVNFEPNTNVNFTCLAMGLPRPTIRWEHNSNEVLSDGIKHSIMEVSLEDDKLMSTIILHDTAPKDSGTILCTATVYPGEGLRPLSVQQEASLSVLNISFVEVHMTDRNQVIFLVELASTVPAVLAMQVTIHGRRGTPLLSPPLNQNCSRLLFIIPNPDFDTSSFSVDVHVQHGGYRSSAFPISFTESPDLLIKVMVPSVCIAVVLIVLIIAVMITCICICKPKLIMTPLSEENKLLFLGQILDYLDDPTEFEKLRKSHQTLSNVQDNHEQRASQCTDKIKSKGPNKDRKKKDCIKDNAWTVLNNYHNRRNS